MPLRRIPFMMSCVCLSFFVFSICSSLSSLQTLVSLHHYGIPITFISHSWSAHLLQVTLKQALINSLVHCFKQDQQEKQSSSAKRNESPSPLSKEEESIEKETGVDRRIEDSKSLIRIEEQQTNLLLPQEVDNQYRYRQTPHWIGLWAESIVKDMKFYANELEYDPKTGISTGKKPRRRGLLVNARDVFSLSGARSIQSSLFLFHEQPAFSLGQRLSWSERYSLAAGFILYKEERVSLYVFLRTGVRSVGTSTEHM